MEIWRRCVRSESGSRGLVCGRFTTRSILAAGVNSGAEPLGQFDKIVYDDVEYRSGIRVLRAHRVDELRPAHEGGFESGCLGRLEIELVRGPS